FRRHRMLGGEGETGAANQEGHAKDDTAKTLACIFHGDSPNVGSTPQRGAGSAGSNHFASDTEQRTRPQVSPCANVSGLNNGDLTRFQGCWRSGSQAFRLNIPLVSQYVGSGFMLD